jgi:hypothetical protein
LKRIRVRQILDVVDADAVFAPLGPEDDEAAEDEGGRHGHRIEQVGLDRLAEQQAEHGERHEGYRDVDGEALCAAVRGEAADHAQQPLAVLPADC